MVTFKFYSSRTYCSSVNLYEFMLLSGLFSAFGTIFFWFLLHLLPGGIWVGWRLVILSDRPPDILSAMLFF